MAKAGKHTGASFTEDELNDPDPSDQVIKIRREMLGGDPSSAGNNSPQSGQKVNPQEQPSKDNPQEPAPTTDSPSKPLKETPESSDVSSTGGSTPETGKASSRRKKPATGARKAAEEDNPKAARVRSTDEDDFDDFE